MKNQLQNQKKARISFPHRRLLAIVWKIHYGLRNDTETKILMDYLEYVWNAGLRNHFLNEEIFISSAHKQHHSIIDAFFHQHQLFRQKLKQTLDETSGDIRENLENLCILLVEIVRFEENTLKPYLSKSIPDEIRDNFEDHDVYDYQNFSPQFWKY